MTRYIQENNIKYYKQNEACLLEGVASKTVIPIFKKKPGLLQNKEVY